MLCHFALLYRHISLALVLLQFSFILFLQSFILGLLSSVSLPTHFCPLIFSSCLFKYPLHSTSSSFTNFVISRPIQSFHPPFQPSWVTSHHRSISFALLHLCPMIALHIHLQISPTHILLYLSTHSSACTNIFSIHIVQTPLRLRLPQLKHPQPNSPLSQPTASKPIVTTLTTLPPTHRPLRRTVVMRQSSPNTTLPPRETTSRTSTLPSTETMVGTSSRTSTSTCYAVRSIYRWIMCTRSTKEMGYRDFAIGVRKR